MPVLAWYFSGLKQHATIEQLHSTLELLDLFASYGFDLESVFYYMSY